MKRKDDTFLLCIKSRRIRMQTAKKTMVVEAQTDRMSAIRLVTSLLTFSPSDLIFSDPRNVRLWSSFKRAVRFFPSMFLNIHPADNLSSPIVTDLRHNGLLGVVLLIQKYLIHSDVPLHLSPERSVFLEANSPFE